MNWLKVRLAGIVAAAVLMALPALAFNETGGSGLIRTEQAYSLPIGRPLFSLYAGGYSNNFTPGTSRLFTLTPSVTLGLGAGFEASAAMPLEGLTSSLEGEPFDRRFDFRQRSLQTKLRWTTDLGSPRLRAGVMGHLTLPLWADDRPGSLVSPDENRDAGVMALLSTNLGWFDVPLRLHLNAGYWWSRNDGAFIYRSLPTSIPVTGIAADQNDVTEYGVAIEAGLRRAVVFVELRSEQFADARDAVAKKENLLQVTPGFRTQLTSSVGLTGGVSFDLTSNDDSTPFDPAAAYPEYELKLGLTLGSVLSRERHEEARRAPKAAPVLTTSGPSELPEETAVPEAVTEVVVESSLGPAPKQAVEAEKVVVKVAPEMTDAARIKELEERLARIETAQRLATLEARLAALEGKPLPAAAPAPVPAPPAAAAPADSVKVAVPAAPATDKAAADKAAADKTTTDKATTDKPATVAKEGVPVAAVAPVAETAKAEVAPVAAEVPETAPVVAATVEPVAPVVPVVPKAAAAAEPVAEAEVTVAKTAPVVAPVPVDVATEAASEPVAEVATVDPVESIEAAPAPEVSPAVQAQLDLMLAEIQSLREEQAARQAADAAAAAAAVEAAKTAEAAKVAEAGQAAEAVRVAEADKVLAAATAAESAAKDAAETPQSDTTVITTETQRRTPAIITVPVPVARESAPVVVTPPASVPAPTSAPQPAADSGLLPELREPYQSPAAEEPTAATPVEVAAVEAAAPVAVPEAEDPVVENTVAVNAVSLPEFGLSLGDRYRFLRVDADAVAPLASPSAQAELDSLAAELAAWPEAGIALLVHGGGDDRALALSRTDSLATLLGDYLVAAGAPAGSITPIGMGHSETVVAAVEAERIR